MAAPACTSLGQRKPRSFQGAVGQGLRCGAKKQVIEGPSSTAGVCTSASKLPNGKQARKASRVALRGNAALSPHQGVFGCNEGVVGFIHRFNFSSMVVLLIAKRSRDLAMSFSFRPTRFSRGGNIFARNGTLFAPSSSKLTIASYRLRSVIALGGNVLPNSFSNVSASAYPTRNEMRVPTFPKTA